MIIEKLSNTENSFVSFQVSVGKLISTYLQNTEYGKNKFTKTGDWYMQVQNCYDMLKKWYKMNL